MRSFLRRMHSFLHRVARHVASIERKENRRTRMRRHEEIMKTHRRIEDSKRHRMMRLLLPKREALNNKTLQHSAARINTIRFHEPPILPINTTTHLINSRICKTSKPTYIALHEALRYDPDDVYGIYEAVNIRKTVTRPMIRSALTLSRVFEAATGALRQFFLRAKKRFGEAWTTIRKIASKIKSWTQKVVVARLTNGMQYLYKLYELVVRPSVAERLKSMIIGFRDAIYRREIRHCSYYAIVKGRRFTGIPSGWYYWHRKWKLCKNKCTGYKGIYYGVCYTICEDLINTAMPSNAKYLLQYIDNIIAEKMEMIA